MAKVYLIAGLGFGDEGKGSIVDYLARSSGAHLVVRYNGGAQAAHNVVTSDGRHHCFSQFGSGTFVPKVGTHLSKHMLVNPITILSEEQHLQKMGVVDAFKRMTVHQEALITNPYQVAANRLRELIREGLYFNRRRGEGRHGSCGMGIGETMADFLSHPQQALRAEDLKDPEILREKLKASRERKVQSLRAALEVPISSAISQETAILLDETLIDDIVERCQEFARQVQFVGDDFLDQEINGPGVVLFEGAQGVLLDEWRGFHPYTTWSTVTFKNALDLLKNHPMEHEGVTRIGVTRTYMTRHGAGPFVTEDTELKPGSEHNAWGQWQGNFRLGHFDIPALMYSLEALGGVDYLAMNHCDVMPEKVCVGYDELRLKVYEPPNLTLQEKLTKKLFKVHPMYRPIVSRESFFEMVEHWLGKILIYGNGPRAEDKRLWQA